MNMKNNNKWLIGGLIGFTLILLTTAIVLFFQLKQPQASPTPKSKPAASPQLPPIQETTPQEVCSISFTIAASPNPSPSPSPNPSPSPSPNPSPSPEPITCFDTCSSDAECEADLRCQSVSGTKRCVNPSCSEDADCTCAEAKKACWDKCQNNNDCESPWTCQTIPSTNDKRCVNSSCVAESDCSCAVAGVAAHRPWPVCPKLRRRHCRRRVSIPPWSWVFPSEYS